MQELAILPVRREASIELVASLAERIWNECYTPLIGQEQVNYMLERFQSPAAIAAQIREGYQYYLVKSAEGEAIGYLAVVPKETGLFLSKIYLVLTSRRRGYGRRMVVFAEGLAREKGLDKVTLTVNKNNRNARAAYEKMGFAVQEPVVQDIGGGFVMDDYRMQKTLEPSGKRREKI
jgi:ribosomal protein S18 acetylase RimI-like enzyme